MSTKNRKRNGETRRLIVAYMRDTNPRPTFAELSEYLGISTSAVTYNLKKLIEAGVVIRTDAYARNIRLTDAPIELDDPEAEMIRILAEIAILTAANEALHAENIRLRGELAAARPRPISQTSNRTKNWALWAKEVRDGR